MKREKVPVECLVYPDPDTPGGFIFEKPLACEVGKEIMVECDLARHKMIHTARIIKKDEYRGKWGMVRLFNPLNNPHSGYKDGDIVIYKGFTITMG